LKDEEMRMTQPS